MFTIIILYFIIGLIYSFIFLKQHRVGRPSSLLLFFFYMLLFWPIFLLLQVNRRNKALKKLPQSMRKITVRNVISFLESNDLTKLNSQEVEWCKKCLSKICIDNYNSYNPQSIFKPDTPKDLLLRKALKFSDLLDKILKKHN